MQKTFFSTLSYVILTLSLVAVACSPETATEVSPTPVGDETPSGTASAIPSDTPATSTPIPTPELQPETQSALPPLMFAIDESRSMVLSECDQERMRYQIPKFLIDVFADMQDPRRFADQPSVIQPSRLSLYYLDQYAISKGETRLFPNYEGSFETARDNGFWKLIDRDSGSANYVYLFDETFYEYKEQLRSTKQLAETPWLILFTDGYFDDKREEAVSTKRELREILQYENARILVYLICPQKYKDDYPGVEDYWLQRASESNGKIIVLGRDGNRKGIAELMSVLLSQVWPVTQNNGSAAITRGWGFMQDGEASIPVPADTLHLFVPRNYLYVLGTDGFELPDISFDGQEVYVPKNIYPRDENCGKHFLEMKNKSDLDNDQVAFYWWYAERIAFGEDTQVPPYIYNNFWGADTASATAITRISIENLDENDFADWQLIRDCFNISLSVNGISTDPVPLQDKDLVFHLPSLGNKKLSNLSYIFQIHRKEENGNFQPYQSIRLSTLTSSRYIPVINTTDVVKADCKVSEPNGMVSTQCTTRFLTQFLRADYYPSSIEWLPAVSACGNLQPILADTLPDANRFLQAYLDGNELVITMNNVEKSGLDSCEKLELFWDKDSWNLQKIHGWIKPADIVCTLEWSSDEKTKQLSIHCL